MELFLAPLLPQTLMCFSVATPLTIGSTNVQSGVGCAGIGGDATDLLPPLLHDDQVTVSAAMQATNALPNGAGIDGCMPAGTGGIFVPPYSPLLNRSTDNIAPTKGISTTNLIHPGTTTATSSALSAMMLAFSRLSPTLTAPRRSPRARVNICSSTRRFFSGRTL